MSKREKISGIYQILNIKNEKNYNGSAIDIMIRWGIHKWLLRNNKHKNKHLQNAWNKWKEENFRFIVLEECERENLIEREQHYIDIYQSYNRDRGYNLSPTAGNTLGYKFSIEQKENIRQSLIGKMSGENNPAAKLTFDNVNEIRKMYKENKEITMENLAKLYNVSNALIEQIVHNKKWKDNNYVYNIDKIENAAKSKLNWELVDEIRNIYIFGECTQKEIAEKYNVDCSTIKKIIQNKTWFDEDYDYESLRIDNIKRRGFATIYKRSK